MNVPHFIQNAELCKTALKVAGWEVTSAMGGSAHATIHATKNNISGYVTFYDNGSAVAVVQLTERKDTSFEPTTLGIHDAIQWMNAQVRGA